ncbi:MAG: hypothetical protein VW516_11955 [Rhodospirillaceae bacterium]|jgi:hypothetical protein
MPKTRDEIENLKAEWREDQGWDLAESKGFEEHAVELGAYQAQVELEQREQAAREHEAAVQKLIRPAIDALPRRAGDNEIGQDVAEAVGSTVNTILRLVAEIVLPLQRQLERQRHDIIKVRRNGAVLLHGYLIGWVTAAVHGGVRPEWSWSRDHRTWHGEHKTRAAAVADMLEEMRVEVMQ